VSQPLGHLAVVGAVVPNCRCRAESVPGLVLDPFMGAGTVAVVAERLGRDWLGIELNPEFAAPRPPGSGHQTRHGPLRQLLDP